MYFSGYITLLTKLQNKSGTFILGGKFVYYIKYEFVLLLDTKVINITDSREKKRLSNINGAFERLKEVIPTFPFEKRLTKIETLKLAISYIGMLRDIMKSNQTPDDFIALVLKGDTRAATWYSQGII